MRTRFSKPCLANGLPLVRCYSGVHAVFTEPLPSKWSHSSHHIHRVYNRRSVSSIRSVCISVVFIFLISSFVIMLMNMKIYARLFLYKIFCMFGFCSLPSDVLFVIRRNHLNLYYLISESFSLSPQNYHNLNNKNTSHGDEQFICTNCP
jgi:hypothetical protein